MESRNLARFRADPEHVRIRLRPVGSSRHIIIESLYCPRCKAPFDANGSCARASEGCQGGRGEHWVMTTNVANRWASVAHGVISLIMQGYSASVPGIDPYMDRAYDHPQDVNTYYDEPRIENDNEMMLAIGFDHLVNRIQ